ncbi:DUF2218 domain-containing protein, partial [Vibrio cholerae]|nr:DUF2218 domain-containing protein [Vibrio cholerae]
VREHSVAVLRVVVDPHIDMFSRREAIGLEWQATSLA